MMMLSQETLVGWYCESLELCELWADQNDLQFHWVEVEGMMMGWIVAASYLQVGKALHLDQ